MKFYRHQGIYFTLITVLFVCPSLLLHSWNIVTRTYHFGATQLWRGSLPYVLAEGVDLNKYAPIFFVLYYPFTLFHERVEALLWGIFNISFFWWGVTRWFRLEKTSSYWLWAAFIFCSMELDGSVRYQQINAFLIGTTLLGLALFRDKRFLLSGLILAFITTVKILPGLFAFALLVPWNKKYVCGLASGFLLSLLIPAFVLGMEQNTLFHIRWIEIILTDLRGAGILDIGTVLSRYGVLNARELVNYPIAFLSFGLLVWLRFLPQFSWFSWISLGVSCLLLASPRSESPTFVLAAPAYIALTVCALEERTLIRRYCFLSLILAGVFLTTLCMNDLWPRSIWNAAGMRNANKTFGVFILWLCSLVFCLKPTFTWRKSWQRSPLLPVETAD